MLRNVIRLIAPLAILAIGGTALFWLKDQRKSPTRSIAPSEPPMLRTVAIGPATHDLTLEAQGQVLPRSETKLSAEVAGRITDKPEPIMSGRYVEADTPLVTIDRRSYEARIREYEALVQKIELDLNENTVLGRHNKALLDLAARELQVATRELKRFKDLSQSDASSVAEEDEKERNVLRLTFAHARFAQTLELLPTQRARLTAQLEEAKAKLAAAQLDVARTKVSAPHAGMIAELAVEEGDFVEPGDLLLTMHDPSAMEVRVVLRDDQLFWIWNADPRPRDVNTNQSNLYEIAPIPVTITFPIEGHEFTWEGVLNRVEGGQFDLTTQSVACRVKLKDSRNSGEAGPRALVKGMAVQVSIPLQPAMSFIKVPAKAVRADDHVFVASEGKLKQVQVEIVRYRGDTVLVREESTKLQPGDRVVVSPIRTAYDGMPAKDADAP